MSIFYEKTGAGPAIVLLHGWGMHGGIFKPLTEKLQEQFTVYAVDLPGHGRSRDSSIPLQLKACVDALIQELPSATWCGWSIGGLFAQYAAHHYPAHVTELICMCSSPKFVRSEDWPQGVAEQIFRQFADQLQHHYAQTIKRFIELEAYGTSTSQAEVHALEHIALAYGSPAPHVYTQGMQLITETDLRPLLPQLSQRGLWISGRRDRLVNASAMQTAAQWMPDGQSIEMQHAGHAPFMTSSRQVADYIHHFLKR